MTWIFVPYLCRLAEQNGVVCTSSDGDQYGVLKHLIDDVQQWGFSLVKHGKYQRFSGSVQPLQLSLQKRISEIWTIEHALHTPTARSSTSRWRSPQMLYSLYQESGHALPACNSIDELERMLDLPALWRERQPFVDYLLGANPGGGVFVVGYCDHPYQRQMLQYYKMGDGPFYTFYRPYHLCHIESMPCVQCGVASSGIDATELRLCDKRLRVCKEGLGSRETLDGIGGEACYGLIENCKDQQDASGIPICLADQVRLKRSVKKDEKILLCDVDYDPQRFDFQLFALANKQEEAPC
ncbi:MAG: hypothetical protein R2912_01975 [Eubacteriales bacterium]